MKKSFSALLVATFLAYVLYEHQSPPTTVQPVAVGQPTPTPVTPTPAPVPAPVPTPSPADATLQAQGPVRIVNGSSSSILLVKTTRLLTADGKLFRLASDVSVPANGQIAVGAYADQLGAAFAIGPTRFSIPGLSAIQQTQIYAVSDASFALAQPLIVTAPTPAPTPVPVVQTPPPAPTPVPAPKPVGMYKDGTYTGPSVDAYYGLVQVAAVIQGGKLTNVKILNYPQDRGTSVEINSQALPILVSEAIQAQSANIDAVSGASETSPAFIQSLTSALAKAKN